MNTNRHGFAAVFVMLTVLFLGAGLFLATRFLVGGNEDTWFCEDGTWIKHGNPTAPQPSSACPGAGNTPTPTPIPAGKGFLEGSLSYPSEGIPSSLTVCAQNLGTKVIVCTNNHLKDPKYTYGVGYKMEVPSGEYYVYAGPARANEKQAYYSEFVTCGLKVDCPSHEPIKVLVHPNETVTNIDPGDWYR